MNVELKLDEAGLKETMSEAILAAINEEQRKHLIQEAVRHLIAPDTSRYGLKESPLQMAFFAAVRTLAAEVVRESLKDEPELQEKLKAVYREAMDRFFAEKRERTIDRIACAIADGFAKGE